jgi:hypothetical protein
MTNSSWCASRLADRNDRGLEELRDFCPSLARSLRSQRGLLLAPSEAIQRARVALHMSVAFRFSY